MVASPRRWEITVARIADCINAIRFEFRQPSLHMQRVTEEEAKKRCFVGLHIRPDRHKSYNKRDASEKQEGTREQPRTGRAASPSIDIFAHS